jgi:hypothetical protein
MDREPRADHVDDHPPDVETHRVIDGRRWRISDPRIPEPLRQLLVDELMSARRAVRDAEQPAAVRAARDRVHDAKVALGERGVAWWQPEPDVGGVRDRILRAHRVLTGIGRFDEGSLAAPVAAITSQSEAFVAATIAQADARAPADRDAPEDS